MQELTTFPNQYKNWQRELNWGPHIPPPHWEFALLGNKTLVCVVQVPYRSRSHAKTYQDVEVGVAPMLVGIACPSFILIST